jgi:hypothetical protein
MFFRKEGRDQDKDSQESVGAEIQIIKTIELSLSWLLYS